MKLRIPALFIMLSLLLIDAHPAQSCTNILVSKGASDDGSVMLTYSADGGGSLAQFFLIETADHEAGVLVEPVNWERRYSGCLVQQVAHTHRVVNLMNEHQLSITETTYGGREELHNPDVGLNYAELISLALQRFTTAREAVLGVATLMEEYGYSDEGETFSFADPDEVWMMDVIGRGPGVKGAVWVACRVPDGSITVHANQPRIGNFPLDDDKNWLFAPDVIDFAIEKGYFAPDAGEDFSFKHVYDPPSPYANRVCAGRVWSIYRRVAPSRNFSPDYFRGVEGEEDYPLFIEPDEKLTLQDVMSLMRDHFEGTPWDMTEGIDAGPFASPYRWRGLKWKIDDVEYCWERPISTQQAAFVMVSQCRGWLPDAIGGVYWYTPDDCYTTCFSPFYAGIDEVPVSFVTGDIDRFSLDSAWWVYNFVSNQAYDRWSRIWPEVEVVRNEEESMIFALQPAVEKTAAQLYERDPGLARSYLTTYSVSTAEGLVQRWRELGEHILARHNDGYVKEPGVEDAEGVEYPEAWLRRILAEKPGQFTLPGWGPEPDGH